MALAAGDGAGSEGEVAPFASIMKGRFRFGDARIARIVAFATGHLFGTFVGEGRSVFIKKMVAKGARLFQFGDLVVGVVLEPGEGAGAGGLHTLDKDGGGS